MHAYDQLELAYQRLTRRTSQLDWLAGWGHPDQLVAAIRDHHTSPAASDDTLRRLIVAAASYPDALTIALHALAPALRARLGRAVTDEYRNDALTDLAFVLLDGRRLERAQLAHRLVNRAHNRAYQAARRLVSRGTVHPVEVVPTDPDRLTERLMSGDPTDQIVDRVDLARFHHAVKQAIDDGHISATAWDTFRRHRLERAVNPAAPACTGSERVVAGRLERRLRPLIETCLHAA